MKVLRTASLESNFTGSSKKRVHPSKILGQKTSMEEIAYQSASISSAHSGGIMLTSFSFSVLNKLNTFIFGKVLKQILHRFSR